MLAPDVLLRWEQAKLGGWMELAGIEPADCFCVKQIKDHPWIGQTVDFPFPQVGTGRVISCMTHPLGQLMFDVEFPHHS
jgi:hypothetical protein